MEKLAENTEGYSGSDLHSLCLLAARAPLKELLRNSSIDNNINNDNNNNNNNNNGMIAIDKLRPLQYNDFIEAKKLVKRTGETAFQYKYTEQQQEYRQEQQTRTTNIDITSLQSLLSQLSPQNVTINVMSPIPSPIIPTSPNGSVNNFNEINVEQTD